jgi:hypothetical protein
MGRPFAHLPDLVGKKFGRWCVIEFSHGKGRRRYWTCECSCGTVRAVKQDSLTCNRSLSCGCLNREIISTRKDLTGKTIGKWHVESFSHRDEHNAYYRCTCKCGTKRTVNYWHLMNGESISCGDCSDRNSLGFAGLYRTRKRKDGTFAFYGRLERNGVAYYTKRFQTVKRAIWALGELRERLD